MSSRRKSDDASWNGRYYFPKQHLAELVKINPKSIGVGQYQHDMNQKKLSEALNGVVSRSKR
ncbi:MAG: hypothetical protein J6C54_04965 [Lachnospiraceae bacterium]|nr:hypothetical protein [Lachnospiraceae bacterium]